MPLSPEEVMLYQTWSIYHLPTLRPRKAITEQGLCRALQSLDDTTVQLDWMGPQQHFRIRVYTVDEDLAAELMIIRPLCFVRGKPNWYKAVVRWLGCHGHGCQWTQEEMALFAARLLPLSTTTTTLVFNIPSHLANLGLDNISLSVPPTSLSQFREAINKECSLVHALQLFVQESFHINLESFFLEKISCSTATISSDGRFKSEHDWEMCLKTLQEILEQRYGSKEDTPTKKAKDSRR